MANVNKYRGGWKVRWRTPTGEYRGKTFARKVDADRFRVEIEHAQQHGSYVDPQAGRITLAEWWARWAETSVDLKPSTVARDDSYARTHLLPAFGRTPLAKIDHASLQAWVATMSARGLAPATVVKAAQIMGKVLTAAVHSELIVRNPMARVRLPKIERQEMRFLAPHQVADLAEAIDPRYEALVLVGAYCGLRLGEMAGLRRHRVNLLTRRIDVRENAVEVRGQMTFGTPKTRAGIRSVPIPRVVLQVLEPLVAPLAPDALVFPAPQGGPLRAGQFRSRVWGPAIRRAGVDPLRIHDLRHTAVALWIAAGATPNEVARRAGHSSVVTVLDRYGHLLPGSEDRVTDALDGLAASMSIAKKLPHLHRSR